VGRRSRRHDRLSNPCQTRSKFDREKRATRILVSLPTRETMRKTKNAQSRRLVDPMLPLAQNPLNEFILPKSLDILPAPSDDTRNLLKSALMPSPTQPRKPPSRYHAKLQICCVSTHPNEVDWHSSTRFLTCLSTSCSIERKTPSEAAGPASHLRRLGEIPWGVVPVTAKADWARPRPLLFNCPWSSNAPLPSFLSRSTWTPRSGARRSFRILCFSVNWSSITGTISPAESVNPGGSLNGHLVIEDIEDVVHVLDEVELDDGGPDQTFLFPGSRRVFQLEVCEVHVHPSRFQIGT
jgi:hypothetical protein